MDFDYHEVELAVVFPPGRTLAEKLQEMGLDANDLASRMGYTPKAVNDILQGYVRVTPEVAISLEMVTEIPCGFWLRRQNSYDEYLARKRVKESLKDNALWQKSFPVELSSRSWLNRDENCLAPLLRYFAVASPKAWDGYYKKAQLKVAFRISLAEVVDECMTGLAELCRAIGIRVLFVQNFKTAPIHGMYRWYKDVPMIMLHNRFEKRETMWFTFFHELAHVLYHGKKGICLRNLDIVHNFPEKEDEADCFAQKCMADAGLGGTLRH